MSDRPPLIIIGAGGHGRVVADAARSAGMDPLGFVEPHAGATDTTVAGLRILGSLDDPAAWPGESEGVPFVVALGSNEERRAAWTRAMTLGLRPARIVHPTAVILGGASLGDGTQVLAAAVIGVDAAVGINAVVNTAATIDHDVVLGAHSFVAPGAHLGGTVVVDEGAHIGIGASVRQGIRIGAWSVVGAGAAVVSDVAPGARVVGVPARPMDEGA